jgi:hypothetical protein
LTTAPVDNPMRDFLPNVALHIHVQVLMIKRIINQITKADTTKGDSARSDASRLKILDVTEVPQGALLG